VLALVSRGNISREGFKIRAVGRSVGLRCGNHSARRTRDNVCLPGQTLARRHESTTRAHFVHAKSTPLSWQSLRLLRLLFKPKTSALYRHCSSDTKTELHCVRLRVRQTMLSNPVHFKTHNSLLWHRIGLKPQRLLLNECRCPSCRPELRRVFAQTLTRRDTRLAPPD
jgi:hypothetical protein